MRPVVTGTTTGLRVTASIRYFDSAAPELRGRRASAGERFRQFNAAELTCAMATRQACAERTPDERFARNGIAGSWMAVAGGLAPLRSGYGAWVWQRIWRADLGAVSVPAGPLEKEKSDHLSGGVRTVRIGIGPRGAST